MLWIFTALTTYFLWAITNVVDKSLLTKKFPSALSYAVLGGIILFIESLLLIPFFGIFVPSTEVLLLLLIGGAGFIYALAIYIKALSTGNASTIVPLTSFAAVFTLLFSWLFFGGLLTQSQLPAFILLIIGGFLISQDNKTKRASKSFYRAIILVFLANAVFGLSYAFQGYVLSQEPFWNSFIWMRIFGFGATLSLLLSANARRQTRSVLRTSTLAVKSIFVGNQFIAFVAFLLLSFSFSIANASLVNALQGAQYAFLFLFVLILSRLLPNIFRENLTKKTVLSKSTAILFIATAIAILAF